MEHLAWVQNREHLILEVKQKWNDVTILVSLITPRSDELIHQTNGQIINALIKQILSGNEMILYCDHSNMLKMVIQMRTIQIYRRTSTTYLRKEFLCGQQLQALIN